MQQSPMRCRWNECILFCYCVDSLRLYWRVWICWSVSFGLIVQMSHLWEVFGIERKLLLRSLEIIAKRSALCMSLMLHLNPTPITRNPQASFVNYFLRFRVPIFCVSSALGDLVRVFLACFFMASARALAASCLALNLSTLPSVSSSFSCPV